MYYTNQLNQIKMSTKEMYNQVFGEGEFEKLDPMTRLKLIEFSTLCRQDGANMTIETINEKR